MLDRNKRRHPLETFLSNIDQDNSKQSPEVSVGIQLGYDYVNLRGDPSNSDFVNDRVPPSPSSSMVISTSCRSVPRMSS